MCRAVPRELLSLTSSQATVSKNAMRCDTGLSAIPTETATRKMRSSRRSQLEPVCYNVKVHSAWQAAPTLVGRYRSFSVKSETSLNLELFVTNSSAERVEL